MTYVVFIMLKRVLRKSKHTYLETDLYYTVICSAASCCPHPLFWIPSAFCEGSGATEVLAIAVA